MTEQDSLDHPPARGRWPSDGLTDPASGLRLRVWREHDVPALVELLSDPDMRRWSPVVNPPSEEDCLGRVRAAMQAEADGRPRSFAVVDGASDEVLGSIDWRNDFKLPVFSVLDLGYGVSPAARGRGVASGAVRLLAEWLLDPDGGDVHRVQLDHAVENVGSCRTAVRAGFEIEGRRNVFLPLREHPDAELVRHDVCLHGRTRR